MIHLLMGVAAAEVAVLLDSVHLQAGLCIM